MIHELKTYPEPFNAVLCGRKTAEFRKDDRNFEVGDSVRLREWDPANERYTGFELTKEISDIRRGPDFDIPEGFAMLSLSDRTVDDGYKTFFQAMTLAAPLTAVTSPTRS